MHPEKRRLDDLMATALGPVDILLAKLVGRLPGVLSPTLVALPLVVPLGDGAGMPARLIGLILAAMVSSVVTMAALTLYISANRGNVVQAQADSVTILGGWLVLPWAIQLPAGWGGYLADAVEMLKLLCVHIGASSPMSLVFDASWMLDLTGAQLQDRLLVMIATQAAVAVLALAGAAMALDTRDLRSYRVGCTDPYRGYRPPCGEDPIVWREYELPARLGSRRFLVLGRHLADQLRYSLALVADLVRSLFIVAFTVLGAAVLAAVIAAGGWFGVRAFLENWQHGGDPNLYVERFYFNLVVRGYFAVVVLVSLGAALLQLPGEYHKERSKGTWPLLLAAPLSGTEIVVGKMKAQVRRVAPLFKGVVVLGPVAVVCGSAHWLGVVLAAINAAVGVWAALLIGSWLGVRGWDGSAGRSLTAVISPVVLIVLTGGLTAAALCSSHELAMVRAWHPRAVPVAIAAEVLVATLLGCFAWSLERTLYRRFDEWVDRPRRAAEDPGARPEAAEARRDPVRDVA